MTSKKECEIEGCKNKPYYCRTHYKLVEINKFNEGISKAIEIMNKMNWSMNKGSPYLRLKQKIEEAKKP